MQSLAIWGLASGKVKPAALPEPRRIDSRIVLAPGQHEVHATVRKIDGKVLTAERRDGTTLVIDTTAAATNYKMAPPSVGPRARRGGEVHRRRHAEGGYREPPGRSRGGVAGG